MKIAHEIITKLKGQAADPSAKKPAEAIVDEVFHTMGHALANAIDEVWHDPVKAAEFLKELRKDTRQFIRPIAEKPGCNQDLCDEQLIAFTTLMIAAGMGADYGIATLLGRPALKGDTLAGTPGLYVIDLAEEQYETG